MLYVWRNGLMWLTFEVTAATLPRGAFNMHPKSRLFVSIATHILAQQLVGPVASALRR